MPSWLTDLLSDHADGLSTIRVVTLVWGVGAFIVWAIECFRLNQIADIPEGTVFVLGLVITGKVIQRFGEKPPG